MPAEEWSTVFTPIDDAGQPIAPNDVPLMVTLRKRLPAHARLRIRGLDGIIHRLEVASIPIAGLDGEFLGAASMFWELSE